MSLIKSAASWNDLAGAQTTQLRPGAPVCLTCGRYVDYNGVVEGEAAWLGGHVWDDESKREVYRPPHEASTQFPKYLVKHHSGEELRTFDMGSTNWDYADVEQMARRTNWFDPHSHEGVAAGVRIENAGEHDDGEPTKVISIGKVAS